MLIVLLVSITSLLSAGTNAHIEVKLFKDWVIGGEINFGNLAIKNTGTAPILLAKDVFDFEIGQLVTRPLPRDTYADSQQEKEYQMMIRGGDRLFSLPSGETHMYEGRKLYFDYCPSETETRFTVSVYLGNDFWLDSEPLMYHGVVPDSEEYLATIANNLWGLVAVTYKNERWLYKKSIPNPGERKTELLYFPVCPLSLTNKIRVEPQDDEMLFKIWDGDKSMIYHMNKSILIEGPDENNVLGKWTRDRKQRAEVDNAEVRRKKAEEKP